MEFQGEDGGWVCGGGRIARVGLNRFSGVLEVDLTAGNTLH
jgi:hypothetical protein